jgi:hypothetical protein
MPSTNQRPVAPRLPKAPARPNSAFPKLPPSGCAKVGAQKRPSMESAIVDEGPHFLKGINFDNCQDLLSIPSPPSPSSRRRRRSMFILPPMNRSASHALKDLSNTPEASVMKKAGEKSSSKNKKQRRSLCHVPSPQIDTATESTKNRPSESPMKQLQLDLESSNHNDIRRQKKRSKRRQSILLPSDAGIDNGKINTTANLCPTPEAMLNFEEAKSTPATESSFAGVQQLVRQFCSLPKGSQECFDYAQMILETTGYPLSLDRSTGKESSDPEIWHSRRRDILTKLGPPVEEMEARKLARAREAELSTSCQVEKRSGKYNYRDKTGNKVSMDEYKTLYLRMVEENKQRKHQEFTIVQQNLMSSSSANGGTRLQTQLIAENASLCNEGNRRETLDHSGGKLGVLITDEKPTARCTVKVHGEESTVEKPRASHSDEVDNALDAMVVYGKSDVTEPLSGCTRNAADFTYRAGNAASQLECKRGSNEAGNTASGQSNVPRLNLVDSDATEASTDPEMAEAEQKLWRAIDDALETYSNDVLAIQARRRVAGGTDDNVANSWESSA